MISYCQLIKIDNPLVLKISLAMASTSLPYNYFMGKVRDVSEEEGKVRDGRR